MGKGKTNKIKPQKPKPKEITTVLLTRHECSNTSPTDALPTVSEHLLKSNYCSRRTTADVRPPEESPAFTGLAEKWFLIFGTTLQKSPLVCLQSQKKGYLVKVIKRILLCFTDRSF